MNNEPFICHIDRDVNFQQQYDTTQTLYENKLERINFQENTKQ